MDKLACFYYFNNLTPGVKYMIEGCLFDLDKKELIKDATRAPIVSWVEFVPTTKSGRVVLTYEAEGLGEALTGKRVQRTELIRRLPQ